MDRLLVDADSLIMALEWQGPDIRHYLDLQTGEVEFVLIGDYGEADQETQEEVETHPDRYLPIDPLPSYVRWEVMSDFVESLRPGKIQDELERAIHGRRPVSRFKDVLFDFPDTRDAWFAFHQHEFLTLARDWLKREGIEADLKPLPGRDAGHASF